MSEHRWVDAPLNDNPHTITRDLEQAIGCYTGAPYVVTTTSCTQAILMALAWFKHRHGATKVWMPRHSYVGVPASVLNAGHRVAFCDDEWQTSYGLGPEDEHGWQLWDCAWQFEERMFRSNEMQAISFHWSKPLGLGQGGAILHDDPAADRWLRRARFDGRAEGIAPADDQVQFPSWHAYLSPEVAATGLARLRARAFRTDHVAKWSDYPDLSTMKAFQ